MFHGGSITVVLLFVRPKDVHFGHLSNATSFKIAIKLGARRRDFTAYILAGREAAASCKDARTGFRHETIWARSSMRRIGFDYEAGLATRTFLPSHDLGTHIPDGEPSCVDVQVAVPESTMQFPYTQ